MLPGALGAGPTGCVVYLGVGSARAGLGAGVSGTPLERLRGSTVQAVKSCEFGVVGFGKPQTDYPEHRGKRLVRAIYVGPQGVNGSGIRVFVPVGDGKPPRLEIFSSFRARDPVEFDKAVLDQLT